MIDHEVHSSYDLIQNNDQTFTLKASGEVVYRGDLKTAVKMMVKKFGFEIEEIEYAVEQMELNDHNRAHFGSFRSFIFTKDDHLFSGVA